jgi:trimeric autotransporter adhesin
MKKTFYITVLAVFGVNLCTAQLFSSGNNVIAGTNVGIGINAPTARLDVANELRVSTNPANGRFYRITSGGRQEIYAVNDLLTHSGQNHIIVLNNNNGTPNGLAGSFSVTNGLSTNPILFRVDGTTGNVGIGTTGASVYPLQVRRTANPVIQVENGTNNALQLAVSSCNGCYNSFAVSGDAVIRSVSSGAALGNLILSIPESGPSTGRAIKFATEDAVVMEVTGDEVVKIGNVTTPSLGSYKLYVEQGILTEKLKVAVKTSASWSDYVFEPGYKLRPLSEVEAFVKNNKHLPGVPSASAMVANGLDVATMDAKLLEKIEELTLYMIEIKKENELLKKQIQSLLK